MSNTLLENSIRFEVNGVEETLTFQELIDIRRSERRVATKIKSDLPFPVTLNDRFQNLTPTVGAMNIAGTQGTPFQITELVEQEKGMVAGAAEVTIVPSIYSIVPPNDGSALRHGHHFEPVDFVIDHGRGHHDAYSAGSCQRTYARACGCRQRPRRHREELIESERGWSGREAFVTMMQTADLGQGNDRSGPGRLNGSSIRGVLAERQVGP